jgi:magnesium-protoporphyrin O-methyltransferase
MTTTDDKTIVRDYFNTTGFDRWQRIYGDGEVNTVQLDIRDGHQQTVNTLLGWFQEDGNLPGLTICDAGCGVGSLSIPLAAAGAIVYATDISDKMVEEAQERAKIILPSPEEPIVKPDFQVLLNDFLKRDWQALKQDWQALWQQPEKRNLTFAVKDLENLTGRYHTVVCLDVLIHYPADQAAAMIQHLGSLAESRLVLSFAPKTFLLTILKKIGEFFPGPSKTTRAYQHREADILQILQDNGFQVQRNAMTSTRFYFSRMLEAVRV